MGRALARHPQAFLLDEPLSNLDAKLRTQLRAELKRIHQLVPTTSIYVTHDQVEAMTLGHRIAVMADGRIQQLGDPQDVYDRPANLFVAGFIGSPPMNLLGGRSRRRRSAARPGAPARRRWCSACGPRRCSPAATATPGPALEIVVEVVEPLGSEVMVHGRARRWPGRPGGDHGAARGRRAAGSPGEVLRLAFDPDAAHVFDARAGRAVSGADGRPLGQPLGVGPGEAGGPGHRGVGRRRARAPAAARPSQPAPPARATTSPARNESPLPTG